MRPTNHDSALYISRPAGPLSAANPQWYWGLDYASPEFSINRYDTAAHTDLRIDVSGNVTVAARLAAKNLALAHSPLPFAASAVIDFAGDGFQTVTLTGDIAFTSANLAAGRTKTIRLVGDASPRALTFPAGWKFVGAAAPSVLAAGKTAVLTLTSFAADDAGVVSTYAAEP